MGGNSRAHIIDDIDGLDGLMKIISARNDDGGTGAMASTGRGLHLN